jgi:hypothetical protein
MSPTSLASLLPPSPSSAHKGPRLLTPTTNSIPLISASNGRNYSAVHTVAVVALFVIQFRASVANPYWIMIMDLVPLALLQCAYCILCLPPTGTWPNTTSSGSNDTASSASAKPSKLGGTGSMRKRPAGLARAGATGPGGWKVKAMVYIRCMAATYRPLTRAACLAYSHRPHLDFAPPSDPLDSPRASPRCPTVSYSPHSQHSSTLLTHISPHMSAYLLYPRGFGASLA